MRWRRLVLMFPGSKRSFVAWAEVSWPMASTGSGILLFKVDIVEKSLISLKFSALFFR